jgi:hypothetical protein
VHVLRAFGLASRAGGVMQDGGRLGYRRINREVLDPLCPLHVERHFALLQRRVACVHYDDVPQVRKLFADLAYFMDVFLLSNNGRGVGVLQPDEKRFIAESGEQRLCNCARLQDAEKSDVQLGHTVHKQADAFAGLDAEVADELRHGVGQNP